jgi:hypothetical protein
MIDYYYYYILLFDLIIINFLNLFIRRIRINFPTDIKRTTNPEIPVLTPLQETCVPMELVIPTTQTGKPIKLDIRNDQGVYAANYLVNDWDLLMIPPPNSSLLLANEFEIIRNRLKGFNEVSRAYSIDILNLVLPTDSSREDYELEIIQRLQREVNMYVVQGVGVGEILFAAIYRKGFVDEKVLLTILVDTE